MVDKRKLLPAAIVCFAIAAAAVILLVCGCAVRHLPGGGTAPATTFEKVLAWNASAAQANDGFADNVIALQQAGMLGIPEAKVILLKQAAIAAADSRITERIRTAANCAATQAGASATTAQLDAAGATCAQISGPGIATDINLITSAIGDLNQTGLTGIKDPVKQKALADLLATVQALVKNIYDALEAQGVIK